MGTRVLAFNKEVARRIRQALSAEVRKVAEEFGLVVRYQGGQFSKNHFLVQYEFAVVGADGIALTSERADYLRLAENFGLKQEWLGAQVRINLEPYAIIGLKPKNRRQPVVIMRAFDQKRFRMGADAVVSAMQNEGFLEEGVGRLRGLTARDKAKKDRTPRSATVAKLEKQLVKNPVASRMRRIDLVDDE